MGVKEINETLNILKRSFCGRKNLDELILAFLVDEDVEITTVIEMQQLQKLQCKSILPGLHIWMYDCTKEVPKVLKVNKL